MENVEKKRKPRANVLDYHKAEILDYLEKGVSIMSISKIINPKLLVPVTYWSFQDYIKRNWPELAPMSRKAKS